MNSYLPSGEEIQSILAAAALMPTADQLRDLIYIMDQKVRAKSTASQQEEQNND